MPDNDELDERMLAIAQRDKNNDEYEDAIETRGTTWGVALGVFFTVILLIIKYVLTKKNDIGIMAVVSFIAGVEYMYKGIKLVSKKYIIEGILWFLATVFFTFVYIGGML